MPQLKDHRLDMGLLVTPLDDRQLQELPLPGELFLLLAFENHPLAAHTTVRPADLKSPGLWLMQRGHCFRRQVLNLCGPAAPTGTITYESGSIETLKELVRRQSGYTLMPELAVLDEVGSNPLLKRFVAPEPVREVGLVVHHGVVRTTLLAALCDLIMTSMPEHLHAGKAGAKVRWRQGNYHPSTQKLSISGRYFKTRHNRGPHLLRIGFCEANFMAIFRCIF